MVTNHIYNLSQLVEMYIVEGREYTGVRYFHEEVKRTFWGKKKISPAGFYDTWHFNNEEKATNTTRYEITQINDAKEIETGLKLKVTPDNKIYFWPHIIMKFTDGSKHFISREEPKDIHEIYNAILRTLGKDFPIYFVQKEDQ